MANKTNFKKVLFGYGVTGRATDSVFKMDYKFDWNYTKNWYKPLGKYSLRVIEKNDCEVWICVPTPTLSTGQQDASRVKDIVDIFADLMNKKIGRKYRIVIRSTILPGTTKKWANAYPWLDIIFFPEFLSDKTAMRDIKHPWFCVIGSENTLARQEFIHEHWDYFKNHKNYMTDTTTAELIKYSLNTLFATLVVFGNQIYDVAKQTGADYQMVKSVLAALPWKEQHHLEPLHNGYRGYGGKCLPKDTYALACKFNLNLLQNVHTINDTYLFSNYPHLQSLIRTGALPKKLGRPRVSARQI
jgi:nucleotide sugar dehydrogenase